MDSTWLSVGRGESERRLSGARARGRGHQDVPPLILKGRRSEN